MSRSVLPLYAAIVVAGLPMGAGAQNGLSELDANDDGKIGRQEAIDGQREAFEQLDRNGDGVIDLNELAASQAAADNDEMSAAVLRARRKARERWLSNLDRDGSGDISLAEYQAAMTPYFDALDTNSDGVLDGEELRRAVEGDTGQD